MLTKSVLIGQFVAAGDIAGCDGSNYGLGCRYHFAIRMIQKLREPELPVFVRLRQARLARRSGFAARFPGLADQALKGLESLPGKLVVQFADLLGLGNGGLVSALHEFGVNGHRLFERPGAAELLEERPELLE